MKRTFKSKEQFIWKVTAIFSKSDFVEKANLLKGDFSQCNHLPKSADLKYLLVPTGTPDCSTPGSFKAENIEKYIFSLEDGFKIEVKYHKIHRKSLKTGGRNCNSYNSATAQFYIITPSGIKYLLFWDINAKKFIEIDLTTWRGSDNNTKNWTHIPIKW